MKLKYYFSAEGKKVYTLKNKIGNAVTSDAHYKFIKIRDVQPQEKD